MAKPSKPANAAKCVIKLIKQRNPIALGCVAAAVVVLAGLVYFGLCFVDTHRVSHIDRIDFTSAEEVRIKSCVNIETDNGINLAQARSACEERIRNER